MTRERIIKEFYDEFWRKLDANNGSTDALIQLEYEALCMTCFQVEVYNGGLDQYFSNSSGDYALDTPPMLRKIGAAEAAEILDEANALFGEEGPSRDREQRWLQLDQLGEWGEERLSELTTRFSALEDAGLCLADLFDEHIISSQQGASE